MNRPITQLTLGEISAEQRWTEFWAMTLWTLFKGACFWIGLFHVIAHFAK